MSPGGDVRDHEEIALPAGCDGFVIVERLASVASQEGQAYHGLGVARQFNVQHEGLSGF